MITHSFIMSSTTCILLGHDYLVSLSGIGLVKANKIFKIARQADLRQVCCLMSIFVCIFL